MGEWVMPLENVTGKASVPGGGNLDPPKQLSYRDCLYVVFWGIWISLEDHLFCVYVSTAL